MRRQVTLKYSNSIVTNLSHRMNIFLIESLRRLWFQPWTKYLILIWLHIILIKWNLIQPLLHFIQLRCVTHFMYTIGFLLMHFVMLHQNTNLSNNVDTENTNLARCIIQIQCRLYFENWDIYYTIFSIKFSHSFFCAVFLHFGM